MWAFPPRDHPFSIASAESLGDGLGSTTSAKTAVTVRKAGAGANAEADAIRAAITMARCNDTRGKVMLVLMVNDISHLE